MVLVVAFLVPLPVDDETIRAYQDQGGDAPPTSRSDSGGAGGETSGMAKLIPQLAEDHPAIAALAASGHAAVVEARIVNSQLPVPQLLAELADATAISAYNGIWLAPRAVPWPMPSPEALVAALPKLKCFQMTSAGYNALDVPGLASKGIVVANNGGANAVSVAEHTLTLLLALQHHLLEMHTHVQAGSWSSYAPTPHRELAGSTVGIVGFGNIGRLVARKLAGFEVELLYSDTSPLPPGRDGELGAKRVPLEELLARSDIVTLHVPLVPSTVGLIGSAELALMKPGAILLNTCRGAVVDEGALVAALGAGELGGFGADVLVDEPPDADHPLLALPNVLITPHLAGTAAPASARSFAFAIENMARLATGEDMLCVVDPADFDAPARSMEAATAPAVTAEPASGATLGTIDSRRRRKSQSATTGSRL
jgi:phosphoglycerate dehydrogenase-like enzyme